MSDIKESDWKIFKLIKENAIEQYCQRCLSEYSDIINDNAMQPHNKYLYLYKTVQNNDKKMDFIFGDNTSRSKAVLQLLMIRSENLADPGLVAQLSEELQDRTDNKKIFR
jgi:hypothetical protein